MIPKSLKMTEKNLSKYHSVLFKWLNENSKSSSFFGEIHALISDYAKVSVQSSVTCCDFHFIPIVSIQWPMVGRQAWCHILSEKNVSTRSHVLNHYQINILVWYYYWYWLWRMSLTFQHWSASLKWWWSWEIAPLEKSAPGLGGAAWNWLHKHQWRSIYFEFNVQLIT